MASEEFESEEPEEIEGGVEGDGDDWDSYPWKRAVAISHDKEDLDSWPCPSCKHPLAFHAVHGSTTTNAFARNHGQDYRYTCDAWLFIGDGVGSQATPGDEEGVCACTFHGIVGGTEWPAEYRPLYLYREINPDTFNPCEEEVEMVAEDWQDYEAPTLDRWSESGGT